MRVLMSIKPEFVERIESGAKKYEFRRVLFRREDIDSIVVYASSPISKVVGELSIKQVLTDSPERIWEETHTYSGITKDYFDSYFSDRKVANAISIESYKSYSERLNLSALNVKRAPQSFCYIQ
jgi:predicted transcriptional regulator